MKYLSLIASAIRQVGQSGSASLRKGKKILLAMSWKTGEQDCQTDKGPMYRAFAVC